ncbi:MAG: hypothetical protein KQH57_07840 [Actinomycetales bacterium]|nr:hypothetical protein [Actinomycetales bacterium]
MTPPSTPGLTVCRSCAGEGLAGGEAGRAAQLERYATIEAGGWVRLATVDCLDQCGRGDAIVVRPATDQPPSAPPVWLADVTTPETTAALRAWLAAGGPGRADLPRALAPHVVPAPGEVGPAAG